MIDTVLLRGFLSREKFGKAFKEIQLVSFRKAIVPIIIDSDGGDAVAATDFINSLRRSPAEFEVKVYEASSASAFVALSLVTDPYRITMNRDSVLGIHRGEITLDPTQITPMGMVDRDLLLGFRKYDQALVETLKKYSLDKDEDLMSEFYATGWMRFSAEECIRRGLVGKLF